MFLFSVSRKIYRAFNLYYYTIKVTFLFSFFLKKGPNESSQIYFTMLFHSGVWTSFLGLPNSFSRFCILGASFRYFRCRRYLALHKIGRSLVKERPYEPWNPRMSSEFFRVNLETERVPSERSKFYGRRKLGRLKRGRLLRVDLLKDVRPSARKRNGGHPSCALAVRRANERLFPCIVNILGEPGHWDTAARGKSNVSPPVSSLLIAGRKSRGNARLHPRGARSMGFETVPCVYFLPRPGLCDRDDCVCPLADAPLNIGV